MRPQRASKSGRIVLFFGALGLAAVLYVAFAASKPGARSPSNELVLPPVSVVSASRADGYAATRRFFGRIEALSATDLSFEVGGKLLTVEAAEGSTVRKGATLATLDTARLENRRDALKAELAEAEARFTLAAERRARLAKLGAVGAASDQAIEDAVAEADATAARKDRIAQALASAVRDLEDARLTAPFAGVVAERYLDPGVVLAPAQPVLRLVGNAHYEALVGIPLAKARRLEQGDAVTIVVGDETAEGWALALGDDVDPSTGTVTLRIGIPDDLTVTSGEVAHAVLADRQDKPGFWLPATALTGSYRGLWTVFVVTPDREGGGVVRRETVTVLHTEGDRAYVAGTIEDGDLIVAEAPFKLVPGQNVALPAPRAPEPGDMRASLR